MSLGTERPRTMGALGGIESATYVFCVAMVRSCGVSIRKCVEARRVWYYDSRRTAHSGRARIFGDVKWVPGQVDATCCFVRQSNSTGLGK